MRWFNFPTGVLVGSETVLFICWALDSNIAPYLHKNDPTQFWAVVGGFLAAMSAVGAALLTINHQDKIKRRERDKKMEAVRAVLPITLSRLYSTFLDCFEIAIACEELRNDPELAGEKLSKVYISPEDMSVIKQCIEYSDYPTSVWLSLIPAHYQFLRSRLERNTTDRNWLIIPEQIAAAGVDWLELRAFCEHLFTFSRTGQAPCDTLPSRLIRRPIDRILGGNMETLLDAEIENHHAYIRSNGGYFAIAYRNRLVN